MPTKKLIVNQQLENRVVFHNQLKPGKPFITGHAEWDYVCGGCMAVICKSCPEYLNLHGKRGLPALIKCNVCGSFNEEPLPPDNDH